MSLTVTPGRVVADFARDGFAVASNLFPGSELDVLQAEMESLQRQAAAGGLPARYAGDMFLAAFEGDRPAYVHYMNAVTVISVAARQAFTRIGWHTTTSRAGPPWASGLASPSRSSAQVPARDLAHLDPTSPANGFLRVVPGSHLGDTHGMPLGFEKVPGETGIYCERRDVLFHHCYLWHTAARAPRTRRSVCAATSGACSWVGGAPRP